MLTQCPECNTVFRLRPEQLAAAGGKVRCGECHHVFQALQHLVQHPSDGAAPPPKPAAATPAVAPAPRPAPAAKPVESAAPIEHVEAVETAAPQDAPTSDASPAFPDAEPEFDITPTDEPVVEFEPSEELAVQPEANAPAEKSGLDIDLDELFGATPPPPPPPAAPADDFGEVQIEALLATAEEEEPPTGDYDASAQAQAVPAQLEFEADTADTSFEDLSHLEIDAEPESVTEFDLPESELTTAQPVVEANAHPQVTSLLEEELMEERRGSPLAGMGWGLGILLLLALLLGQYAYLNRISLVLQYAQLRPALETLCRYTGCELPPRRDLQAITLLERDIHSHDTIHGALVITATLMNRAPFAQPYPDVEVELRDLGGNIVASRRFRPAEYLHNADPAQLFPSQGTAQLELDVADPGADAVGFEFRFY